MILIVFNTPVVATDWLLVYSTNWFPTEIELERALNIECGLVIFILILLVKFDYPMEHLIQNKHCRQ